MPRPDLTQVPDAFHRYINQTSDENALTAIKSNTIFAVEFFDAIPDEKWSYRYAEGKWSIKEMLQHIIDAERIFAYRALCIGRGEKASLPGFEEDEYAAASKADRRTKSDLLEEFETVRRSIEQLFASFDSVQLASAGISNNKSISVNALGFIIPGHVQHHIGVVKERYL